MSYKNWIFNEKKKTRMRRKPRENIAIAPVEWKEKSKLNMHSHGLIWLHHTQPTGPTHKPKIK